MTDPQDQVTVMDIQGMQNSQRELSEYIIKELEYFLTYLWSLTRSRTSFVKVISERPVIPTS